MKRSSSRKAAKFFDLYEQGVSRGTMAVKLGLLPEHVDELLELARNEEEAVEAGGGG